MVICASLERVHYVNIISGQCCKFVDNVYEDEVVCEDEDEDEDEDV